MSYCRTTLVEFNSEKDADEAQADYSKNAASEFPEAEILLAIRTSPTSAIAVSIYPNEETAKKTTVARKARMEKTAHRRKSAEMHQGEVTLNVVR